MSSNSSCGSSKFVGGAELARRKARNTRKKTATRILRPGETLQSRDLLSKKLPAMERFFASLFKSSASDFVQAYASEEIRTRLIGDICRRLGLGSPSRLQAMYKSKAAHFESRAALVMEESRHAVSEALAKLSRGKNRWIRVSLESMQARREPGHVAFVFEKQTAFTAKELYDIRPGCCFEILPPGASSIEGSLLACVFSNRSKFDDEGSRTISLLIFTSFGKLPSGTGWHIRPITTLISMFRQFEACTNGAQHVPFLYPLMGHKGSTHRRFDSDDYDQSQSFSDEEKEDGSVTYEGFILPKLNQTQESALRAFLKSSPNSITMVQGPPGTGKTTLLITIICRYLMESVAQGVKRRLMVCAPTNKAVTVLATRYLDSVRLTTEHDPFNVVMIGDQEKLLTEENSSSSSRCSFQVRNIFVYTWIQGVVDDCKLIQQGLMKETHDVKSLALRTRRLCSRISNSIPQSLKNDTRLATLIRGVRESVEKVESEGTIPLSLSQCWGDDLDTLASTILSMDVTYDLLESADVVFCTLASAGASVVKSGSPIDDLIVDEAAAATEPELYIPFHLKPSRLLVVGDPMQLPATVLSRSAQQLGLNKSLHERLMYELSWDHTMLDVQYRMKPEISRFPSLSFYGGKIANGDNVMCPLYKNSFSLGNGDSYMFQNVMGVERQGFDGSYSNAAEAKMVVELTQELRDSSTAADWHSVDKVRIITFYQAQVSLLKRMLSECGLGQVVVATVDSSQGCEADIVIVSFVRSGSANRGERHSAGFLADERRLNVALTRAKYQLVCVGSAEGLKNMSGAFALSSLAQDAFKRRCVLSFEGAAGLPTYAAGRGKRNKKYRGDQTRKRSRRI